MNTQNIEKSVVSETQVAPSIPDEFEEAYQRRLNEIKAVPDDQISHNNLDTHAAVTTILGALPEIRALREEMARVPQLDIGLVDALEDHAKATGQANSLYTIATTPKEDLVALNAAAMKERDVLRTDCLALATRGLLDRDRLAPFKNLVGYKNVAFELIDYANLLKECWAAIEGKTALTAEEIAEAKGIGMRLVEAAGLREQAPIVAAEAAKIRHQALTLLARAYDEVRRAVIFLRWKDDDADTIAPSLYAGRGGKGRPDAQAPAPTEPAPVEAAGAATPATGAAAPAAFVAAPASGTPPGPAVRIAQGLPGAPPFTV